MTNEFFHLFVNASLKTASMMPRESSISTRPASSSTASASLLPGTTEGKPRVGSAASTNTTELLGILTLNCNSTLSLQSVHCIAA